MNTPMRIVRDGNDYEPVQISSWRLRELLQIERDSADLRAQLKAMTDAGEMLWIVLANVSGGDWKCQSEDWQAVAAKWRDNYFAVAAPAAPQEPPQ